MNKLLVISGPTATGKTALAVEIANKFNGELISADSRQLYLGLDIGVGKDHPSNTQIHLIDLITPDKAFSVAQYRELALQKISEIHSRNKLPILVGCSGFYIDSVINSSYNTFAVKPNTFLRAILNHLPVSFLQIVLKTLDSKTFNSLNHSDLHNPYRLIRKIEIKLSLRSSNASSSSDFDLLHVSLTAPNQFLYDRIDNRVEDRLKLGHLKELSNLLKTYSWSDPGLKIACYYSFRDYCKNPNPKAQAQAVQLWKHQEHADARHQKTWFNKRVSTLIDISRPDYKPQVLELISGWYNKTRS